MTLVIQSQDLMEFVFTETPSPFTIQMSGAKFPFTFSKADFYALYSSSYILVPLILDEIWSLKPPFTKCGQLLNAPIYNQLSVVVVVYLESTI